MTDTLFADISEFNPVVNDSYPYRWLSFRSNDGRYRDRHFAANYEWAKNACDAGRLDGFIVYYVYEPDGGNCTSTLMAMVGTPHPNMVVMIDVESWDDRISGDHSADINLQLDRLSKWLGDPDRVGLGYGNVGDLDRIWPVKKPGVRLVVAAYGSNPSYPGKIAHQYTDRGYVPPFGNCDVNSADGLTSAALMSALGLDGSNAPAPASVDPKLGYNASSWSTEKIQTALNDVMHAGLVVDDIYGPATTAAVHAFEVKYALSVDIGIAGPQVIHQLAVLTAARPEQLDVDGELGPKTITRWQQVMGTTVDGVISRPSSQLVEAVQRRLNALKCHDWDGKSLVVDGAGIYQNGEKYRTTWALQVHLGTPRDGILDYPSSEAVKQLQRNLNAGKF